MDPHHTESWTNEKHLHFLKSMEASFVRTMLENNARILRLDRYLPDSSESTLDLKSQRPKKHATSDHYNISGSRSRTNGRSDRRTRRLSSNRPSQRHAPSQDQVVPQLENRSGDKEERDPPNVAAAVVAYVAPAN
ncbi:uncharacterized protein LOC8258270 isoform X2 [Ricinus communis]|uniref:uncharacterized protein LOC8258270 isoform X2 n=1 Tax=Ricinus communis TaxID=3988 RepID=UPI000D68E7AD|nr:uncharacterized protein LOC8258270 isoform X2 [Ricinus communis]|eukprot:XP_025013878.1 uncharacterized protein LOC8258270 isoform X2 [Ricinus communis]